MTPEEAVTAVKAAGYEGIEWSVHFHGPELSHQPTRLHRNDRCFLEPTADALSHARRLCEDAELRISGLGLGGQFNRVEGIQQAFELAEIAGSRLIRIQAGHTLEGQSFAAAFDASVRLCEAYAREAEHTT
jgi:sugar phosphate isomerase/epimerase